MRESVLQLAGVKPENRLREQYHNTVIIKTVIIVAIVINIGVIIIVIIFTVVIVIVFTSLCREAEVKDQGRSTAWSLLDVPCDRGRIGTC